MFITLEGPDGCGKSSQIPLLAEFLRQQGCEVLATREPGGTAIGEQIRGVIGNLENTEMQPRTEILLFQASRAQHVEQVIRPCLARGGIVISDRYADSTLAYQGFGYQLDLKPLRLIIDFATGGLKPDLTLLLDLDVKVGLQRKANGAEWNRLDALDLDFHQRVRQGYLQLAREEPGRWVLVDAERSFAEVQAQMRAIVSQRIKPRRGAA